MVKRTFLLKAESKVIFKYDKYTGKGELERPNKVQQNMVYNMQYNIQWCKTSKQEVKA